MVGGRRKVPYVGDFNKAALFSETLHVRNMAITYHSL